MYARSEIRMTLKNEYQLLLKDEFCMLIHVTFKNQLLTHEKNEGLFFEIKQYSDNWVYKRELNMLCI